MALQGILVDTGFSGSYPYHALSGLKGETAANIVQAQEARALTAQSERTY